MSGITYVILIFGVAPLLLILTFEYFYYYEEKQRHPRWVTWVGNLPSRYIRMCLGIERKTIFRKKK